MRPCCAASAVTTASSPSPNPPAASRPGAPRAGRQGPAGRMPRKLSSRCILAGRRHPATPPSGPPIPPGPPTGRPADPTGRLGLPARWHGHPSRASVFLPGGSWLCANLTVPAALQDCVLAELTDQALQIAAEQAEVERWFYVRTADPAGLPQLTLRFHGPARSLNQTLLPALHRGSGQLRAEGLARDLCLASYWPELGRYGGSDCMEAAERLFHRD